MGDGEGQVGRSRRVCMCVCVWGGGGGRGRGGGGRELNKNFSDLYVLTVVAFSSLVPPTTPHPKFQLHFHETQTFNAKCVYH